MPEEIPRPNNLRGGEQTRCPVLTGRDRRGRTTYCGALRDPVSYGLDGLPVHQRSNG